MSVERSAAVLFALAMSACSHATAIRLAVDTDSDAETLHLEIDGASGAVAAQLDVPLAGQPRPVLLTLRPASDTRGELTVDVRATDAHGVVLHERVRTHFVPDRIVALPILLSTCACAPACAEPLVCDRSSGRCVDVVLIAAETLGESVTVPRSDAMCAARDGGVDLDASDVGIDDVGTDARSDANVDAAVAGRTPCAADAECGSDICQGDDSFASSPVCRAPCSTDAECVARNPSSHCVEWQTSGSPMRYACTTPCDPLDGASCPTDETCALLDRIGPASTYYEFLECRARGGTLPEGGTCAAGVDPRPELCADDLACSYETRGIDGGGRPTCARFCRTPDETPSAECGGACCGAFPGHTVEVDGHEIGRCRPSPCMP